MWSHEKAGAEVWQNLEKPVVDFSKTPIWKGEKRGEKKMKKSWEEGGYRPCL